MKLDQVRAAWQGRLIVSCQAAEGSPLAHPPIIKALALVAEQNGAAGVRIAGADNIRAAREAVGVPLLGIEKKVYEDSDVYITPTFGSAALVAASGADVIALDGTARRRPRNESFSAIVERIHTELERPVMADVATLEEGIAAVEEAGADFVGTTLSGYTPETRHKQGADFELVEGLAGRLSAPVICEGRLHSPDDVRRAFECGAFAVCVGTAITGVDWLVRQFVRATPGLQFL